MKPGVWCLWIYDAVVASVLYDWPPAELLLPEIEQMFNRRALACRWPVVWKDSGEARTVEFHYAYSQLDVAFSGGAVCNSYPVVQVSQPFAMLFNDVLASCTHAVQAFNALPSRPPSAFPPVNHILYPAACICSCRRLYDRNGYPGSLICHS